MGPSREGVHHAPNDEHAAQVVYAILVPPPWPPIPPPRGGTHWQHGLCDVVPLPQGGAGVEAVRRQGRGITMVDAPADLGRTHGPEAEQGGAPREQRDNPGGEGGSQALVGRDRDGVARVTLGHAVEPPRQGRGAYRAANDAPRVDDPPTALVQAGGGEGDRPRSAGPTLAPGLARSEGPGRDDPVHLARRHPRADARGDPADAIGLDAGQWPDPDRRAAGQSGKSGPTGCGRRDGVGRRGQVHEGAEGCECSDCLGHSHALSGVGAPAELLQGAEHWADVT